MTARRLILVTGMPRSGTTTIGDVLGTAPGAAMLYEPMNFASGDRVIGRYFEVPGSAAFPLPVFDDLAARIARLELRLKPGVFASDRGLRRLAKRLVGGGSRASLRRARWRRGVDTVIWKDPIAAFAVRRLVETKAARILIALRSPFACAASFKRMGWGFALPDLFARAAEAGIAVPDFGGLVQAEPGLEGLVQAEPGLEGLVQAEPGLEGLVQAEPGLGDLDPADPVVNAALLWTAVYGEHLALAAAHPEQLRLVDLEAIIQDPAGTYRALFDWLDLPFGAATEAHLARLYRPRAGTEGGPAADPNPGGGAKDVPGGRHAHAKDRNLAAANRYWTKLLSPDEIALVGRLTAPVRERHGLFTAEAGDQGIA